MKRAGDFAPRDTQPTTPPHPQAPHSPSTWVAQPTPEGRERLPGGGLKSLMDPVDGLPHSDLAALLSQLPESPAVLAATAAILSLDRTDEVPENTDDATLQTASELLVELGQVRLLCRLAGARPILYVFAVGASEKTAAVLARAGHTWPHSAGVNIVLSTALPVASVRGLWPLLWHANVLGVEIFQGDRPDEANAWAIAHVLEGLNLSFLTLSGGAMAPGFIVALAGIAADAICVAIVPPADTSPDEFNDALAQLVARSGATALNALGSAIDKKITIALMACRTAWDRLAIDYCAEAQELLSRGTLKVERLVLHNGAGLLIASPWFIRMLHGAEVKNLVVHGPMSLSHWAQALHIYADTYGLERLLVSLEADLFWPQGDDAEAAVALASTRERVEQTLPPTLPLALRLPGYERLDVPALARLRAASVAQGPMRIAAPQQAAVDGDRVACSKIVADMLAKDLTVGQVVNYLKAPGIWLIPRLDLTGKVTAKGIRLDSTQLLDKLFCVLSIGLPDKLVNPALAQKLAAEPDSAHVMCNGLIAMEHRRLEHDDEAWEAIAFGYVREWVRDGMSPGAAREASPVIPIATPEASPPQTNVVPPHPADRSLLVLPHGANNVRRLQRQLRARFRLHQQARRPHAQAAINVISSFVESGHLHEAAMTRPVCQALASELLHLAQWKLLQHLLPFAPVWQLDLGTPAEVDALAHMAWTAPASECQLVVSSNMAEVDVHRVIAFGDSVEPHKLSWHIRVEAQSNPASMDALKHWFTDQKREGQSLGIAMTPGLVLPTSGLDALTAFVESLQSNRMRCISLTDVRGHSDAFEASLFNAIKGCDIQDLYLNGCSDNLTLQLLVDRPWQSISVLPTAAVAARFVAGGVSARRLITQAVTDEDWAHLSTMLGACVGLTEIELPWGHTNGLALANALDAHPSITSVKCVPTSDSAAQTRQMMSVLSRNSSLVKFEVLRVGPWVQGAPALVEARARQDIGKQMGRNLLLHPELVGPGAGRGLGLALAARHAPRNKSEALRDVGEHIGRFLDWRSALALSATTRASYVGSRHGIESEIGQLSHLLTVRVPPEADTVAVGEAQPDGTTRAAYAAFLAAQIQSGKLKGVAPASTLQVGGREVMETVISRVIGMRKAGVSDELIGMAIGRRLYALFYAEAEVDAEAGGSDRTRRVRRMLTAQDRAQLPSLVEALAYVGVVPARQWLSVGYGIDVPAVPADPITRQTVDQTNDPAV